jgi:hypothetical protein
VWSFIRSAYIDFTVNKSFVVKFLINWSFSSDKLILTRFRHNCNHKIYLFLTNNLLKLIFRGIWANTWATVIFLWCIILYKNGYCWVNDSFSVWPIYLAWSIYRCRKDRPSWVKHTFTPHFDGHLWRKYGQKNIKDSAFPR